MTSRSLLNHLLLFLLLVVPSLAKQPLLASTRLSAAPGSCLAVTLLPALVTILITILFPSQASAGSNCLGKCDCLWKSNKLIADCGAIGLKELPEAAQSDPNAADIQVLNLTRNTFNELKKNIFKNAKMVNLQRIFLRKVGLENIDAAAFFPLSNLVELDLSYNSLKSIPSRAFEPIPKLRDLELSNNQIESIAPNSFLLLPNLRTLSLERNYIKYIDERAFDGLKELTVLKLSDNQLNFLDSRLFSPLINVHTLTLSGNKWKCDCRMRQLREYLLMNPGVNVNDKPKCNNSDKVWTHIDLNSFLCAPKIVSNTSESIYPVEQGKPLALQCSFYMSEGFEFQALPIKWFWQERPIGNNSKGVVQSQEFIIREFDAPMYGNSSKKTKVSRLEISLVLEINQGTYSCQSKNEAGSAQWNFTVLVTKEPNGTGAPPNAAASIETNGKRSSTREENNPEETKSITGSNSVVIGLVLGILFGVFLVLVLFGVIVVVVCRRRQTRRRTNGATNRVVAAESELEKLAPSTISISTTTSVPTSALTLINPVQKPPRLGFAATLTPTTPTATPQVWLIKRNTGANGSSIRSDGDGCCETPLPLYEFDHLSSVNTLTTIASMEPDLIHHPSAYVRNRLICNEEQISIHSDGTEV